MDTLRTLWLALARTVHYLANLQWSHRPQPRDSCLFCNLPIRDPRKIIYHDNNVYAIHNRTSAGKTAHYLIFPAEHVRDIESLNVHNLELLNAMQTAKEYLLAKNHNLPDFNSHATIKVHSGYHRGRRPLIGDIWWPDVVSIQHLHLHVIVEPRAWWVRGVKYPTWMSWMWRGDNIVLERIQKLAGKAS